MALRVTIPILLGCTPEGGLQATPLEALPSKESSSTSEDTTALSAELDQVQEALDTLDTATTAAERIQTLVERMRVLALESASETMDDSVRDQVDDNLQAYSFEVDRIAATTAVDGTVLTDGSTTLLEFQFVDDTASPPVVLNLCDLTASTIGVDTGNLDISTAASARPGLDTIDTALDSVAHCRARYAAKRRVLESIEADLLEALDEPQDTGADWDTGGDFRYREAAEDAQVAQVRENIHDGLELIDLMDAGATQIEALMDLIRALAEESAEAGHSAEERAVLNQAMADASHAIDKVSTTLDYQGIGIGDGTTTQLEVQTGLNNSANDRVTISLPDLTASALGVDTGSIDISTRKAATQTLSRLDYALESVAAGRSRYSAQGQRLELLDAYLEALLED